MMQEAAKGKDPRETLLSLPAVLSFFCVLAAQLRDLIVKLPEDYDTIKRAVSE